MSAIGSILVLCLSQNVQAEAYPEQPVTVVVHTSAGAGMDTVTRFVFQHLERRTGETFVIANFPGASGQVGYTQLALAEPDGHTIGAITTLSIVTHEMTREQLPYKLADSFAPIAQVMAHPSALVVRADSPFQTFEDVLAYAEQNPGELNWGGTFLYGAHHMHYMMVNRATGLEATYVPFNALTEARAALLGGHIDITSGGLTDYANLLAEGEVRVLASGGAARSPRFPDVPTYRELGVDVVIGSSRGFSAPAGIAPERRAWLESEIAATLQDPQFLEEADARDMEFSFMAGEEYHRFLLDLQEKTRALMPADVLVQN
jgi:tripartite-type tricarboxylate transporter receptor subunit TctC